jgi:hypothetical protein
LEARSQGKNILIIRGSKNYTQGGRLSQVARTTSSTAAATLASIFETLVSAIQKQRKF